MSLKKQLATPPEVQQGNPRSASLVSPLQVPAAISRAAAAASPPRLPPLPTSMLSTSLDNVPSSSVESASGPTTTVTVPLMSGAEVSRSAPVAVAAGGSAAVAVGMGTSHRTAASSQISMKNNASKPREFSSSFSVASKDSLHSGNAMNPLTSFHGAATSRKIGMVPPQPRNRREEPDVSFSTVTDSTKNANALDYTNTFTSNGTPLRSSSTVGYSMLAQPGSPSVPSAYAAAGAALPVFGARAALRDRRATTHPASSSSCSSPALREGEPARLSCELDASRGHGAHPLGRRSSPGKYEHPPVHGGAVGSCAADVEATVLPRTAAASCLDGSHSATSAAGVAHLRSHRPLDSLTSRGHTGLDSFADISHKVPAAAVPEERAEGGPFKAFLGNCRVPLAVAVMVNIVITVVLLACLTIVPLYSVSLHSVDYVTSRLSLSLAMSFTRSVESNLRLFANVVDGFTLAWVGTTANHSWKWTNEAMPTVMQHMCEALVDTEVTPYVLYMSFSSPYSGYSAYCSQQYASNFLIGNYITDNTSQRRYFINQTSYTYTEPPTEYCAAQSMTPAEYTIEFASPANVWDSVVMPWYTNRVAGTSSKTIVSNLTSRTLNALADTGTALPIPDGSRLNKQSGADAYWRVVTHNDTTVITYTHPFIDYLGNPSLISAALQPQGLVALYPEGLLSVNAYGRAMVVDVLSGVVLFNSWLENTSVEFDNWDASCPYAPSVPTRRSLYMDEISDPLMAAAVTQLGGRSGMAESPVEVKRWIDRFDVNGTQNLVVVSRVIIDSDYSNMNLFVIYTMRKGDFTSAITRVSRAALIAVILVLFVVLIADLGFLYLFVYPLRGIAAGLRDAAQLRDGRDSVNGTASIIKEIAEMQFYFQIMNRQLMRMKTFLPQGMLGASSGSSDVTTGMSDGDASFFRAARSCVNVDDSNAGVHDGGPGTHSRVLLLAGDDDDDDDVGDVPSGSRLHHRQHNRHRRNNTSGGGREDEGEGSDDRVRPFRNDNRRGGRRHHHRNDDDQDGGESGEDADDYLLQTNPRSLSSVADGAQLHLNEQVLRDQVNHFRRRYCSVIVFCMHLMSTDVNVRFLNEYCAYFMEGVLPCALRHGGVIELQRPDYVVVSFGAHNKVPMHQNRAAKCALEVMHVLNTATPIGPRVGCLLDASEYYVGTCGAAHRNAVVTYNHGLISKADLIRVLKSVQTQILLTQPLASTLDKSMLLMPVDCIILNPLGQTETILYELRGHVHMLPPEISEVAARQIIRAVRMGFVRMLKGDFAKALEQMEPYEAQELQAARLARLCRFFATRNIHRPFVRSVNRLTFTEGSFEGYDGGRALQRHISVVSGSSFAYNQRAPSFIGADASLAVSHFVSTYTGSVSPSSPSPFNADLDPAAFLTSPPTMRLLVGASVPPSTGQLEAAEALAEKSRQRSTTTTTTNPLGRFGKTGRDSAGASGVTPLDVEGLSGAANADGTTESADVSVFAADGNVGEGGGSSSNAYGEGGEEEDEEDGALFEMFAMNRSDDDDDSVSDDDDDVSPGTEADGGGVGGINGRTSPSISVGAESRAGQSGVSTTSAGAATGMSTTSAVRGPGAAPPRRRTGKGELPLFFDDYEGNSWRRSYDVLGTGAFATVYRGLSSSGDLVALKCFQLRARNIDINTVVEEVRLFANLHHENVVQYLGLYASDRYLIEIMEFVPGGSLDTLLTSFGSLETESMRRYLRDIVRGLAYLHEQGIVHCDIKPHNVLLAMDGQCKLSDFGSAMARATSSINEIDDVLEMRGTPGYMSPEVARGEVPTMKSDVYSLGVAVAELLTGKLPWAYVANLPPVTSSKPSPPKAILTDVESEGRRVSHTQACVASPHSTLVELETVSVTGIPPAGQDTHASPSPSVAVSRSSAGSPGRRCAPRSLTSQSSVFTWGTGAGGSHTDAAASLASGWATLRSPLSPSLMAGAAAAGDDAGSDGSKGSGKKRKRENVAGRLPDFRRTSIAAAAPQRSTAVTVVDAAEDEKGPLADKKSSLSHTAGSTATMSSIFNMQRLRPIEQVVRSGTQLVVFIGRGWVEPDIPDYLEDDVADFLRLCLHPDPAQRASASELLRHPWLM